jgi:hypothetical protein
MVFFIVTTVKTSNLKSKRIISNFSTFWLNWTMWISVWISNNHEGWEHSASDLAKRTNRNMKFQPANPWNRTHSCFRAILT